MDNDYNDLPNDDLNEESFSYSPSNMDYSTFKIRNDTEDLLFRIRLDLMNAYKKEKVITDKITGQQHILVEIHKIKGVKPCANKQGIAEIMSYIENYVNGHTVQTNFINTEEEKLVMRSIAFDIVKHFMANRVKWEMCLTDCDMTTGKCVNLIHIFLKRGLNNEERKGYSESMKETIHKELKQEEKEGFIKRLGTSILGFGGKK